MLTTRQLDIIFLNLFISIGASFAVTMCLSRTPYYLTGAAVTLVLIIVSAGLNYMSGEGDK